MFMLWSVYPFSNIGIICNHTSWPLVCRKSNFPLPFPPLSLPPLDSPLFPLPSLRKKIPEEILVSSGSTRKVKPILLYVWSPSGSMCGYMCEAHLAICVKPIWQFVWRPSGNLCEDHLAICVKPIWQFVRRPYGNLCEANLAICVKLIWLFTLSPSGYSCDAHLCWAHLAICKKPFSGSVILLLKQTVWNWILAIRFCDALLLTVLDL